jgi:hypothetical protein
MATTHSLLSCPGCGAPLSLIAEAGARPEDGVLVCEHGHLYDLADPADDSLLQASRGSSYKIRIWDALNSESANHASV